MTIDQFWSVVEGLPTEGVEHALEGQLIELPSEDLVAFDRHFTEQFFETALHDPETLAGVVKKGENLRNQAFATVAADVYRGKPEPTYQIATFAIHASRLGRIGIPTTKSSAQSTCPNYGQSSDGDEPARRTPIKPDAANPAMTL